MHVGAIREVESVVELHRVANLAGLGAGVNFGHWLKKRTGFPKMARVDRLRCVTSAAHFQRGVGHSQRYTHAQSHALFIQSRSLP